MNFRAPDKAIYLHTYLRAVFHRSGVNSLVQLKQCLLNPLELPLPTGLSRLVILHVSCNFTCLVSLGFLYKRCFSDFEAQGPKSLEAVLHLAVVTEICAN